MVDQSRCEEKVGRSKKWFSLNLARVVAFLGLNGGIGLASDVQNGACAYHVMVSKIQWKPFWLATQLYSQNDETGWQNGVNNDVFAQALFAFSGGGIFKNAQRTFESAT